MRFQKANNAISHTKHCTKSIKNSNMRFRINRIKVAPPPKSPIPDDTWYKPLGATSKRVRRSLAAVAGNSLSYLYTS